MTIKFFWRLPVDGDGRDISPARWTRGDHSNVRSIRHDFARTGVRGTAFTYYDQLVQIGRAAELAGFDGVRIPQSASGEEPLIVAGTLAREVRRLTLLPSIPPLLSAVYAAKIATSFQRLTGNRLALELTTLSTEPGAWHGRDWSEQLQVERNSEFLDVFKGFWTEPGFSYRGRHYEVEKGGFDGPLAGYPLPLIHLSGDSDAAVVLSGRHADVHVIALAPIDEVAAQIDRVRAAARQHGRSPLFALQADIVARHSDEEAWAHVAQQWADAGLIDPLPAVGEGAIWRGLGALQPGAGHALVGSHTTLAARLGDYGRAGISSFLLSANPHLEEAYRIGEHLLPLVRADLDARATAA